jgi:carbon monoxide dehydrogenase subunit G
MEMQGSRQLAVTQQQGWDALNDPEVLKACIPGCERMDVAAPNEYAVGIAVRVGPVAARFNGKVALSEVNPPQSYTISFDAQAGAAGFGRGDAKVRLTPLGTGCELAYDVRAQVGGKIAQVGQRLIDGVARSMAEDFFKRFDQEMQRRYAAMAGAAPAAQPAAPRGIPAWVWLAALVVIAAIAWLALRS